MAQYRQGTQRSDQAWNLHGLAVRAAIQIGLHSRSASSGLSPVEAEMRKRTWFGCMILDRTLSMTFGRPCMISNSLARLDLPIGQSLERLAILGGSSNSMSTLEPLDTVCFFTATIELYYVLGDIISQLYGDNVDVDPGLAISTMLERTVALEQRLTAWKRNLVPQLQRRPWSTIDHESVSVSTWDPVFDRLSVILTLRYLNTRIVLHRPVLSAFLRQRARAGNPIDYSSSEDDFFKDLGDRSVHVCQQSAMEIIEIVYKTSKPPALLGAWWFTTYYTSNAALVIFGCILLELTSTNTVTAKSSQMTSGSPSDSTKVVEMILRLQQAMEALKRFGEGTKSAKRIRKTLVKLTQICMTLVQSNPEQGPVILSALTASQHSEVPQANGQSGLGIQHQGAMDDPTSLGGVQPNLASDDAFGMFDMGIQQYWPDGNLDLFTDLVGVEPGLTAMMAG